MIESKAHPISNYFVSPYTQPPTFWMNYPEPNIIISGFLQHKEYTDCFVPIINNEPNYKYFYCNKCNAWKAISTSTAHIRIHFHNIGHNEKLFLEKHALSLEWKQKLDRMINLFILTNGLPFRLVDDPLLQIIPDLNHRKALKNLSYNLAKGVRSALKSLLERSEFCCISVDEWSSVLKKRFCGISCHTITDQIMQSLTLAHVSMDPLLSVDSTDHAYARFYSDIIKKVLEEYNIESKVLIIITDNAKTMKNSVEILNDWRIDRHLPPYLWGNCVCHSINLLLSKYINLVKHRIEPILDLQMKLSKSEVFTNFLIRKNAPIIRIPGYTEVRWYSLFKLLKAMKILKQYIEEYYQIENLGLIDIKIWLFIEAIYPSIEIIKTATKALEGENPSIICYVLFSFNLIFESINSIEGEDKKILKEWNKYYWKIYEETKHNWEPLLEVACFLHPGMDHNKLITLDDRTKIVNFLLNNHQWNDCTKISAIQRSFEANTKNRSKIKQIYRMEINNNVKVTTLKIEKKETENSPFAKLMNHIHNNKKENLNDKSLLDEISSYNSLCSPGAYEAVEFWKTHFEEFPKLSIIANRILALIPSNASVERQFSVSKRIEGIRRACLNDETLEDQVLITSNQEITISVYDLVVK